MAGIFSRILARKNTITEASLLIAGFSLVAKLLGLFRDRLLAAKFGATEPIDVYHSLDVYYAAFKIPDLVYNLLILGALTAAFIPIFTEYISAKKEEEGFRISSSFLNLIVLALLVLGIIIFFLAPFLVKLIAPGFTDPEKIKTTVDLTRIMLASPILFGISNIAGGVLNCYKRFLPFAIAPVFYNLGIILGIIFGAEKYGVYGPAIGVVIGAFLHMLIQVLGARSIGFRFQAILNIAHPAIKRMIKLMIPRVIGVAVVQVNILVQTIIASTLAIGSIAIINLADNLQSFPVNLFGIALSAAVFPTLAELVARGEPAKFEKTFSRVFRQILFLVIPASIMIILLRAQIVRLILGAGLFGWVDTKLTAAPLGVFAVSLFAQALIPLVAKAFYAFQDTKTPLKIALVAIIINILASLTFTRPGIAEAVKPFVGIEDPIVDARVVGLAIGFSLATIINLLMLYLALREKLKELNNLVIIISGLKILVASIVAGLSLYGTLYLVAPYVDTLTGPGLAIQTIIAGLVGLAVYLLISYIFGFEELKMILRFRPRIRPPAHPPEHSQPPAANHNGMTKT